MRRHPKPLAHGRLSADEQRTLDEGPDNEPERAQLLEERERAAEYLRFERAEMTRILTDKTGSIVERSEAVEHYAHAFARYALIEYKLRKK